MSRSRAYVGLDVRKETIAVAIADHGRNGGATPKSVKSCHVVW